MKTIKLNASDPLSTYEAEIYSDLINDDDVQGRNVHDLTEMPLLNWERDTDATDRNGLKIYD